MMAFLVSILASLGLFFILRTTIASNVAVGFGDYTTLMVGCVFVGVTVGLFAYILEKRRGE